MEFLHQYRTITYLNLLHIMLSSGIMSILLFNAVKFISKVIARTLYKNQKFKTWLMNFISESSSNETLENNNEQSLTIKKERRS